MDEIIKVLLSVLGVILTGLATWATTALTAWLNAKVKDKKLAKFLSDLSAIVITSVKTVYQTYVEALKDKNVFNKEAQKTALDEALKLIKTQLTPELIQYIEDNFGDVDSWLKSQIESTIYSLKSESKRVL